MIFRVLHVFVLLAAVAGASADIRHSELDYSYLVDTGPTNYAISSPILLDNGWSTISVNGNELIAITPTCQTVVKDVNSLSDSEKGTVQMAKGQLETVTNSNYRQLKNANHKFCTGTYSIDGNQQGFLKCDHVGTHNFQNDQHSFTKMADGRFSMSKPIIIPDMSRLFVDNDVFTVVYRDATVKMRPIACLSPEEKQAVEDSRLMIQQVEEKFKQDMEEFHRKLNQDMQNMRQKLQQDAQERNQKLQQDAQERNQKLQQDMQNLRQQLQQDSQQDKQERKQKLELEKQERKLKLQEEKQERKQKLELEKQERKLKLQQDKQERNLKLQDAQEGNQNLQQDGIQNFQQGMQNDLLSKLINGFLFN